MEDCKKGACVMMKLDSNASDWSFCGCIGLGRDCVALHHRTVIGILRLLLIFCF